METETSLYVSALEEYASDNIEKYIEFTMRKDDIEDNIKEKERALEYKRLRRLEELEE